MNKVYITSLHLKHGGVEMAITLLANALVKRSYDVEILCIYNLGEPVYKLDDRVKVRYLTNVKPNREEFKRAIHDKRVINVFKEGLYSIKVLYLKKKTMVNVIKHIKEGAVIATRIEHATILSKYGKDNIIKIAQLHHDHGFSKKICNNFIKRYDNIDYSVVLTDLLNKEVSQMMKDNSFTKHITIPNFITSYPEYSNDGRKNKVIAVGRLCEVKGFDRLIDIWSLVKKEKDYVLEIIGDGDDDIKSELQRRIRKYGLEDSVILMGALNHDQVIDEMRSSKAYVMTSHSEAFPFVLLEAMSVGLPVIAYDVRVGPAAIIRQGINGYLIKDWDDKGFSEKICDVLNDKKLFLELSNNAFIRANEFSEDAVMKNWLEII